MPFEFFINSFILFSALESFSLQTFAASIPSEKSFIEFSSVTSPFSSEFTISSNFFNAASKLISFFIFFIISNFSQSVKKKGVSFALFGLDNNGFLLYKDFIMNGDKVYAQIVEQLRNFILKGKYTEALEIYINSIREFSDAPELRNIGGDILNKLNRIDEALIEYERCIELYRKRKLYANAIAIGKKILRIAPHYEHIYAVLGDVYIETGLVGESILNYLEYAEKKRKSLSISELDNIFNKIVEMFGESNKILIQTLSVFPELKKLFAKFQENKRKLETAQKKDLVEMIKRDPEFETFNKLVEMEIYRSRRYVRPFSIFSIEIDLVKENKQKDLSELEKIFGILKNNLRIIDYVFLNTDGLFYGLLPETPSDGVFILSDRIVNRLKTLTQGKMNVSMRWSTYPKDGQNLEALLQALQKSGQVYF